MTCEHCEGTGCMPVLKSTGRQRTLTDGTKAAEIRPGRVPCPFCKIDRGAIGNAPLAGREHKISGLHADHIIADDVDDYGPKTGSIDAIKFYSGKL